MPASGIFEAGSLAQLQRLFTDSSTPLPFYNLILSADSTPYNGSETYPVAVSIPSVSTSPLLIQPVDWTLSSGAGGATASLSDQTITGRNPSGAITAFQWILNDPAFPEPVCWGAVSPPFTFPASPNATLILSGITLTLGTCSPGGGAAALADGTFDSPLIGSATFTSSPAWPAGTWVGGALGSSGSAFEPPANPPTPQYCILQGASTPPLSGGISQIFEVPTTQNVRICAAVAQRSLGVPQTTLVAVDGVAVDTISGIATDWTSWASDTVTLTAGSHTIQLANTVGAPLDSTLFFTAIALIPVL